LSNQANFSSIFGILKKMCSRICLIFGNSALKLCGWSFDNIFRWDNEKGTHEVKVVFGYEYSLQILSKLYFVVWISEDFKKKIQNFILQLDPSEKQY
jgi:hypothetical protein